VTFLPSFFPSFAFLLKPNHVFERLKNKRLCVGGYSYIKVARILLLEGRKRRKDEKEGKEGKDGRKESKESQEGRKEGI
jgi:hypothetical protein